MTKRKTSVIYRSIYLVVLFGIWLTLVGLLLKKSYLDNSSVGTVISLDTGIRDIPSDSEWMTIYHHGRKLGHVIYSVRNRNHEGYIVTSTAQMKIAVAGIEADLLMKNKVSIDTLFRLKSFDFQFQSGQYTTQLHGEKIDNRMKITQIHGTDSSTQEIIVSEDLYTYVGIQPMLTWHGIHEGQKISVPAFDPVSMKISNVEITHEGKDMLSIGTETYRLNKIRVEFNGIPAILWLDDNGLTYREETIMGLVMERTTPEEALKNDIDASGIDLLEVYAIPVETRISNPSILTELTLEIEGIDPAFLRKLNTERQTIVQEHPLQVRLRPKAVPQQNIHLNPFLEASGIIQSQHSQIRELAREIAGEEIPSKIQVNRLNRWVYRYLEKRPVVSLSSSLEILEGKQGDCSEHTILFTALSRGAGIPTKIHIGVVYLDGRFLYHAWPVVYVDNKWNAVDPTLGQPIADATHLVFLESDFTRLSELIPILGRVSIRVIEQKYAKISS